MHRLALVLTITALSTTAWAQLPVPLWRQCGESWSGDRLGTCSETMCSAGCAVTSKAMIFAYYGGDRNPGQLNACLRDNGGYADGCLVYWNDTCAPAGVHYAGSGGLDGELDAGYPVLAQVRSSRTSMHFVVITGRAGGGNYFINDPGWSYNTTAEAGYTLVRFHNYHGAVGPPPHPVIEMAQEVLTVEGQDRDFCAADGIFDLGSGQTTGYRVTVTNVGDAVAVNVVLGLWIEEPFLSVASWEVSDNWRDNPCGGDWCLNDANDHPDNPPHDGPGGAFELYIYALSPGESKRVDLVVEGTASTLDLDESAALLAWVRHIDDFYEKAAWDSGFNNVGDYQTFNGGDLRVASEVDVMGVEACNGVDDDCDGRIDEEVCVAPDAGPDGGDLDSDVPDDAAPDADDPTPDDGGPDGSHVTGDDPLPFGMEGGCGVSGGGAGATFRRLLHHLIGLS